MKADSMINGSGHFPCGHLPPEQPAFSPNVFMLMFHVRKKKIAPFSEENVTARSDAVTDRRFPALRTGFRELGVRAVRTLGDRSHFRFNSR